MLVSIVSYGLALGTIYALIGITYNVMFTASRVFSFTAGHGRHAGRRVRRAVHQQAGHAGGRGLRRYARGRRGDRHHHRDRDGAARPEEPGPASLRAVHPRLRPDDPAAHRDRMEHGAAAVSAPAADRSGHPRPAILAADAGLRDDDRGPRAAVSLYARGPCLPRDRRGQRRRPRARACPCRGCAWPASRWPA